MLNFFNFNFSKVWAFFFLILLFFSLLKFDFSLKKNTFQKEKKKSCFRKKRDNTHTSTQTRTQNIKKKMSTTGKAVDVVSKCISNRFKQQEMVAWQPLFTPRSVIPALAILGIIFLPIGIAALVASSGTREVTIDYEQACSASSVCRVPVELAKPLRGPVHMYYELAGYYQNYRMYAKSKSYEQLTGEWVGYSKLGECDPIVSANESHADEDIYYPCGLIAWSMFNDTFQLMDPNGTTVPQSKHGIAWRPDREQAKNVPPEEMRGIAVVDDVTDEDFLVWLRSAAFPRFRKLYRRVEKDRLPRGVMEGNYTVIVHSNYPVAGFDHKRLVLAETSWIGGKNPAIGIMYIVVGGFLLLAVVGLLIMQAVYPRKLGDLAAVGLENIKEEEEEGSDGDD